MLHSQHARCVCYFCALSSTTSIRVAKMAGHRAARFSIPRIRESMWPG